MKTNVQIVKSLVSKDPLVVFPFFEEDRFPKTGLSEVDDLLSGQIKKDLKSEVLTGKKGAFQIYHHYGKSVQKIVVVGLGKTTDPLSSALSSISGQMGRLAKEQKCDTLSISISERVLSQLDAKVLGESIGCGVKMGVYEFEGYQKDKKDSALLKEIKVSVLDKKVGSKIEKGLTVGVNIAQGVNTARTLANTPANILSPKEIVTRAKALVKKHSSLTMQIIDEKKAKSLGMNAFLGVGQGSAFESYMLIINYQGGKKSEASVAWVGKGVTFDTGGISIKPSNGMREMKGDMGGAAAVFGAMESVSLLKPKQNIMAIMPLVENMPSSTAQRPGDVVTAMNGKSIEITNTDAEGRLILADALCYAVTKKPKHIVDLATLTGAALVALGHEATAIMGNDQDLVDAFKKREVNAMERLWQLPLYDEFMTLLKSDIADMINANENRLAGTCTAGKFLEQFVDETPWIHLDIAPTMSNDKTSGADVKGMSGAGVRTLVSSVCN